MIGRTRPPILQPQRADRRVMGERRWLVAAAAFCTAAIAGPPAPGTAHPPPPVHESQPQGAQESQPQGVPDDEFIEFLGTDDVGDETWWEFLKKAPPRRENPPAPPQETKP